MWLGQPSQVLGQERHPLLGTLFACFCKLPVEIACTHGRRLPETVSILLPVGVIAAVWFSWAVSSVGLGSPSPFATPLITTFSLRPVLRTLSFWGWPPVQGRPPQSLVLITHKSLLLHLAWSWGPHGTVQIIVLFRIRPLLSEGIELLLNLSFLLLQSTNFTLNSLLFLLSWSTLWTPKTAFIIIR